MPTWVFINIIALSKESDGHLMEATALEKSKNTPVFDSHQVVTKVILDFLSSVAPQIFLS